MVSYVIKWYEIGKSNCKLDKRVYFSIQNYVCMYLLIYSIALALTKEEKRILEILLPAE